tara:strand:+ start:88 stop:483 length:396 start_codon:yes stop_codon:yes gene_type:complete
MKIIRKTKTVELLLGAFKNNKTALSIIELADKFSKQMDKSTVYRILERLEQSNILHSFIDKNGLKRYAKGQKENKELNVLVSHPHFLCEECGTSICLPIDIKIEPIKNYVIKSSQHLLTGWCKDCLPLSAH